MNINFEIPNFQRIKMHRMYKYSRKRFEQVCPVYRDIVIKITMFCCRLKMRIPSDYMHGNVQNYILEP